jgi:polysaccharide pyruvyl transferase WcaK-like protein
MDPEFWSSYDGFSLRHLEEWDALLPEFRRILVRGVDSQTLLANKGISATVVGDPALLFAREKTYKLPKKRILGINIGHCRNILWGNNEEEVFRIVAEAATNLIKYGWKIRLFCIHNEDLESIVRLQQHLGLSINHIIQEYENQERYIEHIEVCDVFLGLKLHSVVFPFCRGVPSIMVEYRPKCRDFMKTLGAEERCLRCDQITPQILIEHVYNAYENAVYLQEEQIYNSNIFANKLMQEFVVISRDLQQL